MRKRVTVVLAIALAILVSLLVGAWSASPQGGYFKFYGITLDDEFICFSVPSDAQHCVPHYTDGDNAFMGKCPQSGPVYTWQHGWSPSPGGCCPTPWFSYWLEVPGCVLQHYQPLSPSKFYIQAWIP